MMASRRNSLKRAIGGTITKKIKSKSRDYNSNIVNMGYHRSTVLSTRNKPISEEL